MKFEFQENGKILGHQGRIESVDIAIGIAGIFYFGFKRSGEKIGYEIRGLMEYLQMEKIKMMINEVLQEYAYRKILHETRRRGFTLIQEERLKAGSIKLVLRKVA